MKKTLTFLILSISTVAFGQFNEGIGTFKDQARHSARRTKVDPGFVLAGEDGAAFFGGKEASIIKVDQKGQFQWSKVTLTACSFS